MSDFSFLTYLSDPFGVRHPIFCLKRPGGGASLVAADEIADYMGLLVTYDLSTLTDCLRGITALGPKQPIDIGEALRLCVALPKDEGGEDRWNIWKQLTVHFDDRSKAIAFEKISKSQTLWPPDETLKDILESSINALEKLWANTLEKLENLNEMDRFLKIEVNVQAIFCQRQYNGLSIDIDKSKKYLTKIENDKYKSYAKVASALGVSPTGLNFWNIQKYLDKTDVSHLTDISDGGKLREAFKICAHKSQFAKDFIEFVDSSKSEMILQRSIGSDGKIYPFFHVLGSISGRILVSDPHLQQLKREYRDIISADDGYVLSYLDYAQFEPGILAFLSNDEDLIRLYNSGDVYLRLSESVFGSPEFRSLSKRIFLAYSYGMTAGGIAKLLYGLDETRSDYKSCVSAVEGFFGKFPGLAVFRKTMEQTLLAHGSVSSLLGNRRVRSRSGELDSKEKRWALNQPVQATASLIFKKALIQLSAEFGPKNILLPVHDAVLMQFLANSETKKMISTAESIMISAYKSICPDISPKVTIGDFHSAN